MRGIVYSSHSPDKTKRLRPDGLIVISQGSKRWTALIESKIGNADLTQEQVESYLELARRFGVAG